MNEALTSLVEKLMKKIIKEEFQVLVPVRVPVLYLFQLDDAEKIIKP